MTFEEYVTKEPFCEWPHILKMRLAIVGQVMLDGYFTEGVENEQEDRKQD